MSNVIVRDDAAELGLARELVADRPAYLSPPGLMEVAWVLRKRYGLSAAAIQNALTKRFNAADIVLDAPGLIGWALARSVEGVDFADMILLTGARECERFMTFDRTLQHHAAGAPVPVELLA